MRRLKCRLVPHKETLQIWHEVYLELSLNLPYMVMYCAFNLPDVGDCQVFEVLVKRIERNVNFKAYRKLHNELKLFP